MSALTSQVEREGGRRPDELRRIEFVCHPAPAAAGSVLVRFGNTQVLCGASVENKVPPWMKAQGVPGGWVTAEYSLLPYATAERTRREVSTGKPGGRTQEIQRLIGRSLRAVVDLEKLGERTIWVDCDVLQADGGTRTAAITGGFVALRLAVNRLLREGRLTQDPVTEPVAAVSVGIIGEQTLLDLCYAEDVQVAVDMNVVMTASDRFVEVQGAAEKEPFTGSDLERMLNLAGAGIRRLIADQTRALQAAGA